ncbi:hypothetical protein FNV43_RR21525 [Rhamnella rubrinervis]|uniref:Uncharacterized protein n=1 Tax=Rhamnella rubrinervis TaxID=2594499 RepID=A0A8K0GV48_9ROSA|nr:hypothetical protein FNV43_RR21525 [Rhamnella rubrinervis]
MCVFSEDHEAPSSASSGSSSSASKALGFSLTSTVDSLDMVNAFEVVPKSKKSAPSVWKLMALVDLLLKQAINNARERDRRTLLRTQKRRGMEGEVVGPRIELALLSVEEPMGDIVVFLTGQDDIDVAVKLLTEEVQNC